MPDQRETKAEACAVARAATVIVKDTIGFACQGGASSAGFWRVGGRLRSRQLGDAYLWGALGRYDRARGQSTSLERALRLPNASRAADVRGLWCLSSAAKAYLPGPGSILWGRLSTFAPQSPGLASIQGVSCESLGISMPEDKRPLASSSALVLLILTPLSSSLPSSSDRSRPCLAQSPTSLTSSPSRLALARAAMSSRRRCPRSPARLLPRSSGARCGRRRSSTLSTVRDAAFFASWGAAC